MIAPLRAWHRRWWLVWIVALPLLIVLALAARQEVPPVDELPADVTVGGEER